MAASPPYGRNGATGVSAARVGVTLKGDAAGQARSCWIGSRERRYKQTPAQGTTCYLRGRSVALLSWDRSAIVLGRGLR
jgi:hypothetical protein